MSGIFEYNLQHLISSNIRLHVIPMPAVNVNMVTNNCTHTTTSHISVDIDLATERVGNEKHTIKDPFPLTPSIQKSIRT